MPVISHGNTRFLSNLQLLYVCSRTTASLRRGHASFAQSPNSRSVSTPSARSRSGSTQTNVPLPPQWPNVRGDVSVPEKCGCLLLLELEAEPPVVRVEATEVGDHSGEARELDARRLGERLRRDQRRREQLAHEARRGPRASRADPRAGGAAQDGLHPERAQDRLREILLEGHLRVRGDPLGGGLEAGIRVDPPRPRLRDRRRPRRREARKRERAGAASSSPAGRPARRGRSSPPRPRRAPPARRRAS